MFIFTESDSKSVADLAVALTEITVRKIQDGCHQETFFLSLHSRMS